VRRRSRIVLQHLLLLLLRLRPALPAFVVLYQQAASMPARTTSCILRAAATMALKKKKLYQNQLEAVENNMLRVSEQQMGLENLRTTVEAVDALRTGAHASKATMQVRRGCRGGLKGGFGWMEAKAA
jgi:hypothetical protein